MDIVLQRLAEYKLKVGGLGTIAVALFALVMVLLDSIVKHPLGPLYILADFG